MNKKGFTLIELITTFALSSVIIILLLNIINIIKDIYNQNSIKSELSIEQSNLSKLMNEKFSNQLKSYYACSDSDFCYIFNFENGESSKLMINDEKIQFDKYIYILKKGIKVESPTITRNYVDINDESNTDNLFNIKIPIKSKLYPKKDFGIDLVFVGPSESNLEPFVS